MALGALLACIVLAYGYSDGGGLDGPCLGSQWSRRVAQEGDYIASRSSNGLPGVRCVVTDYETGDVIAERVFPGGWTWGYLQSSGIQKRQLVDAQIPHHAYGRLR